MNDDRRTATDDMYVTDPVTGVKHLNMKALFPKRPGGERGDSFSRYVPGKGDRSAIGLVVPKTSG